MVAQIAAICFRLVSPVRKIGFIGGLAAFYFILRLAAVRRKLAAKARLGAPGGPSENNPQQVLTGAAACATTALSPKARATAEFEFKRGVNTPETHPLTVRLMEAARGIGAQSSDRLKVTVFSDSQLGGDPEMLRSFASAVSSCWRPRA